MEKTTFRSLPLIAIVAALFITVPAQIQNGTITGVVSDPTGALIAKAVVRLDHPVTGHRHENWDTTRRLHSDRRGGSVWPDDQGKGPTPGSISSSAGTCKTRVHGEVLALGNTLRLGDDRG